MTSLFAPDQFIIIAWTISVSLLSQTNFDVFKSSDNNKYSSAESKEDTDLSSRDSIIDRLITHKKQPDDINDGRRGVIYARVSSIREDEENKSLDDQAARLQQIATQRNINLPHKTCKDGDQSGQNFDRPEIQHVEELAVKGEISHLLVDSLDRLGRDFLGTLAFVYRIRRCGVIIVTARRGDVDIKNTTDLIFCVVRLISADIEISNSAEKINEGRRASFQRKNWNAKTDNIPFGYDKNGAGWLEKNDKEAAILKRAFAAFIDVPLRDPYAKTVKLVSELNEYDIGAAELRRIMPRPVYFGKPTYGIQSKAVEYGVKDPLTVADEELEIIPEETFVKYLNKKDALYQQQSGGSSEALTPADMSEECGLPPIERSTEELKLHCAEPRCDAVMTYDGTRSRGEKTIHQYVCPDCGAKCQYPRVGDVKEILNFLSKLVGDLGEYV